MKVETREVYKCDHCNKLYQIKKFCADHELSCSHNPDNERACIGCVFLEKKNTTLYEDSPMGGEIKRDVELLYCEKVKSFLYPPKVEIKKNWHETHPETNLPMPRGCDIKNEHSSLDVDLFKDF